MATDGRGAAKSLGAGVFLKDMPQLKCAIMSGMGWASLMGAFHEHTIVRLVERKTGYAILTKVDRKTSDFVSGAIIRRLKTIRALVKAIIYNTGK